ncbi:helix-turn-helix domain-containing protein [Rhizobium laguerreae]|uniref:helix-turn-helix domain-containing protein n=1 Tax=Rhizobium laguerreae TaxID=1076926 RepID=UPI001C91F3CA|nr:helix-turn-helix transcriptional regulator [Rhizobium laguerreae]MBY3136288.1 helix-turn-helix transcriptional regulator [Rhizobium laguerreae]
MSYFLELDPKEEAVADLVSKVGKTLQRSLVERGISQNDLAARLDVHRSHVSKSLSGFNNLTLKTIAEFCWAIDAQAKFEIVPREAAPVDQAAGFSGGNVIVLHGYSNANQFSAQQEQGAAVSPDSLMQALG